MRILLVDDNNSNRIPIKTFLSSLGHKVVDCTDVNHALTACQKEEFDLVLASIKMPCTGIELLKSIRLKGNQVPVVILDGQRSFDTAIRAIRQDSSEYLLKPAGAEELDQVIPRVTDKTGCPAETGTYCENIRQSKEGPHASTVFNIQDKIGIYSSKMRNIINLALKLQVDRRIPVLIAGETGTGKELIARLIHGFNPPDNRPFIDINCAAIPPTLFESELFGYEPGAFTGGMTKGQKGKLDLAANGTIFLDEVGDLQPDLQSKLLRVVQERTYYRVGGLTKINMDARIICATNKDLEEAVRRGSFRKDLYYRIKVGYIYIPPLRERKNEIIPLAKKYLEEFSRQNGKRFKHIREDAAAILLDYNWPGNIRELRNLIELVVCIYDDTILTPNHLEILFSAKDLEYFKKNKASFNKTIQSISVQLVKQTLSEHNGNKTAAAHALGISRRSLYRLLERIEKPR